LGQKGSILQKFTCVCGGKWRYQADADENLGTDPIVVVVDSPTVQAITMKDFPRKGQKLNLQGGVAGVDEYNGLYEVVGEDTTILNKEETFMIQVSRLGKPDENAPFYNIHPVG
jgi:hypothetical protein